jgi:hypothetical protein
MSDPRDSKAPKKLDSIGQIATYDPPGWISTEELEDELFRATVTDTVGGRREDDFGLLDAYLAETERMESECEYRRALLRLLSTLRPQVAHLLGGPHVSP